MNIRFSPPIGGIDADKGLLSKFFGKKSKSKDVPEENEALDVGKNGEPLFKEDIIAKVLEELERRRGDRASFDLQCILNSNFLIGNQFCDINPASGEVQQQDAPVDWLEMRAFNHIHPLIETRIANLKKLSYSMKVNPRTNELDDYAKADVSTSILSYIQSSSDFKTKHNTAIRWNELCGNCFYMAWWDSSKGELVAEVEKEKYDEEGNLIGHEKEGIFQGDVDYCVLSPYEVYPEDIGEQGISNQRSVIVEQVMKVDDIKDLYGIEVEGSEIATFELTPVASGGGYGYENTVMSFGHKTARDSEKVVTYFERPSRHKPRGQMIIIVGADNLVYYGDLPYKRIPIVQMVCGEVAGQFFGKSTIENLIPFQKEYNSCKNRLHEYIKRISIGNPVVEEGSIDIDEYCDGGIEPGRPLIYKSGYSAPHYMENQQLPNEILQELYNLRNDMEYVAGVSQLMVTGSTPTGVTSGTAIESLRDIDNTRLSLTGDHIRNAVKDLGQLFLEIYKDYAKTPRVVNYVGSNDIAKALTWCGEDIDSTDVEFTTENELLHSEEMQKQKFIEAYNMGLFTDENGVIPERIKAKVIEYMKLGTYSELMSINDLHLQTANRENIFFLEGVLPEISEFDNHVVHFEEHERLLLQMNYKLAKKRHPEMAKAFEDHMRQHKMAMEQEKVQEQMRMQALSLQMQQGG